MTCASVVAVDLWRDGGGRLFSRRSAGHAGEPGRLAGGERGCRGYQVRGAPGVRPLLGRDRRRQRQLFLCASQSPRTHGPSAASHPEEARVARRVLLDPFVPGCHPFDTRTTRGEDLQRLCRLRPRQGDLRLPTDRLHIVRRLRHRRASQLCVDAQRHDDHHDPARLGRRRSLQELGGTDGRPLHGDGPRVRVGVRVRDRARVRAWARAGAGAGVRFSDPSLLLTAAVALTRWARALGRRE